MTRYWPLILIAVCIIGITSPAQAQDKTVLSFDSPTATLQTGTEYEIAIRVDNASEVWLANVEIDYDPTVLYVIGTKSGSPLRPGDFFHPPDSVFTARNSVQGHSVLYTASMLAPADPVSGSGVIATLRVYPLKSGTARLSFARAELTRITFTGEGANRTGSNPQPISFTPVLLDLTVTGNPVSPPSEATATPPPTETPDPFSGGNTRPTQQPTLVNVTAAPVTDVPLATLAVPLGNETSSPSIVLTLAVIVMIVGGLGAIIVFFLWRRSRNR